jgi:hypothetical protein
VVGKIVARQAAEPRRTYFSRVAPGNDDRRLESECVKDECQR